MNENQTVNLNTTMNSRFCSISTTLLVVSAIILVATMTTTANCSSLSSREHDESLQQALGLFTKHLDCGKHCKMTTRLSEIISDLKLNSPDTLAGLDKSSLLKANPEVSKSADLLLFHDRKMIVQLAEGLFGILTSNCRPEVRAVEQSLRNKLDEWKWPAKLRFMVAIIETYEDDCLHGHVIPDMDDE